jgi:photosystem II reaction center protein PsbM
LVIFWVGTLERQRDVSLILLQLLFRSKESLPSMGASFVIRFAFSCALVPALVANVLKKAGAAALPVAAISAPAFALDSIVEALPSNTVALQVQGGAYLAVILGTLLPCLFLINLFIQTESRKAGKAGGQDSE